jgi:hypothetical protein
MTQEMEHSRNKEITSVCNKECTHPCGVCNNNQKIIKNIINADQEQRLPGERYAGSQGDESYAGLPERPTWRIIFAFSKKNEGVFYSHLSLMEIFSMAFLRAGIPVKYSQGFNPLPKLEIAAPLSVGIEGDNEIASIDTQVSFDSTAFVQMMNQKLPEGIRISGAINVFIPVGEKKRSLSSLLWGYAYRNEDAPDSVDLVQACDEKKYRQSRIGEDSVYGLERVSVLAQDSRDKENGGSYFEVYKTLYPLSLS